MLNRYGDWLLGTYRALWSVRVRSLRAHSPELAQLESRILLSAAVASLARLEHAARRMPQAVVESTAPFVAAFNANLLWEDLAHLKQELGYRAGANLFAARSTVGVTSVLTAGYVLWTLRGGWLVADLLAQMPARRLVDPLVVLDYLEEEEEQREEGDSLEGMLEKEERTEHPVPSTQ